MIKRGIRSALAACLAVGVMSSVLTLETLGSESNTVTVPVNQESRRIAVAMEAPVLEPQPPPPDRIELFGDPTVLANSPGMPYAAHPMAGLMWFPALGGLPIEPDEIPWDFTDEFNDVDSVPSGDVEGVDAESGRLLSMPVSGRATSRFGMRFHPILRVWKLHTGHDWAAACGTPVGASAPGVVTRAGWAGGNGIQVRLDHGQIAGRHVVTTYNHLSAIGVRLGQEVLTGQGIGRVGTTGYSTGCHLHFELIVDGAFTDPIPWLNGDPSIVDITTMGRDVPEDAEVLDPSEDPSADPTQTPDDSEDPKPIVSETPSPDPSPSPAPPTPQEQTPSADPPQGPTSPPQSGEPTSPPSGDPSSPPPSQLSPSPSPSGDPWLPPSEDPSLPPSEDPSLPPSEDPSVPPSEDPSVWPSQLSPSPSPSEDPSLPPSGVPLPPPSSPPGEGPSAAPPSEQFPTPTASEHSSLPTPTGDPSPSGTPPRTRHLVHHIDEPGARAHTFAAVVAELTRSESLRRVKRGPPARAGMMESCPWRPQPRSPSTSCSSQWWCCWPPSCASS